MPSASHRTREGGAICRLVNRRDRFMGSLCSWPLRIAFIPGAIDLVLIVLYVPDIRID